MRVKKKKKRRKEKTEKTKPNTQKTPAHVAAYLLIGQLVQTSSPPKNLNPHSKEDQEDDMVLLSLF